MIVFKPNDFMPQSTATSPHFRTHSRDLRVKLQFMLKKKIDDFK